MIKNYCLEEKGLKIKSVTDPFNRILRSTKGRTRDKGILFQSSHRRT